MLTGMSEPQQMMQPSPVPEQWFTALVTMQGGALMVRVDTRAPNGIKTSFLPCEAAIELGEMLIRLGRQGTGSLILPPGVTPSPNGHTPPDP